jgi:hypothetical protein
MKLLYAWIIFGYVCNNNPNMDLQCEQIYIPGVISPADCTMRFASHMARYNEEIAKNRLSLTDVEVYCLPSDPEGVDKPMKLSYPIL